MRTGTLVPMVAVVCTLVFGGAALAQRPPDGGPGRGGPGGPGGPGAGLDRALRDLKISEDKREIILEAARGNQDNVSRMTDFVSSGLLLKIKEIVSPDEYKTVKEATDKVRVATGGRARVSEDDVVDRILAFDKNKTGKVTKEDLPERMQYLIEKGDTNKDGALDREEIKKLAVDLAKEGTSLAGGRGGNGGNAGNGGGRGGNPPPVGPGSGLSISAIEKAVADLKLSDPKKEAVAAAIKTQKDEASKLTTLVRSELQLEIGEMLTSEEFSKVKTILDRQPAVGERPIRNGQPQGGGRGGPPRN